MNLQIDPNEAESLFSLLTGQGGSEKDLEAQVASTPAPVQPQSAGPISANTQNPIPTQAGFYDLLAGTPQASVSQEQVESPDVRQTRGAMTSKGQPAPQQAQAAQGNPLQQIFNDPNALLLLGATLAQRGQNESVLQAAGRGLVAGAQYLNAKSRQQILDQRTAEASTRADEELALRGSESAARVAEAQTRTRGLQQQQAETEANKDSRRRETQLKIDALEVKLGQARTEAERSRIQNQMDNIKLAYEQKYGEQLAQGKLGEQNARTRSLEAQADENAAQAGFARKKTEAFEGLPKDDQRRVLLGGAARSLKTREDRLNDFVNKNLSQYQDPRTGQVNIRAALADFDEVDRAADQAPGTPKQQTPESVRAEAQDALRRGAPKDKVNARLKQLGYAPID